MATALDICSSAAEEIGVKTAEIALEDADFQTFFSRMNDMLLEWDDIGVIVGYTEVLNGDDTVNIDRNAIGAVKYNLAIRLAPSFQKLVTAALAAIAGGTLEVLMASSTDLSNIAYPDTLPLGSGNQCANNDTDRRFFPNNKTDNF